jgi:hypothetical protein
MNQIKSSLISLLHFKIKTNSLNVFEVHHRTKSKSIHLIIPSATYFDFQFQKVNSSSHFIYFSYQSISLHKY